MKEDIIEFGIGDMMGIAMTLGVMAIGAAYILNVLGDVRDTGGLNHCDFTNATFNATSVRCCYGKSPAPCNTTTGTSAEYNSTADAITGISKLPSKLPLIATIVIAAIVISILVRYLWVKYKS